MRGVLHRRDTSLPARIDEAIGRKPNTRLVPVDEPLQNRLYQAQERLIKLTDALPGDTGWMDELADDLGTIVAGWQTAGRDHSRRVPRAEPYEFEPEHAYEPGDAKITAMHRTGAWD